MMPERVYRTVDKRGWGPGPWETEPDKVQWVDEATGLDCLAVRSPGMGHWCGYVGVAEGHPFFGRDYSSAYCGHAGCSMHRLEEHFEMHGGITYSDFCQEGDEAEAICHVPLPGRPERVYWFGFDCAHLGDQSPGSSRSYRSPRSEVYRDLPYVRAQCADLARQLVAFPASTEEG